MEKIFEPKIIAFLCNWCSYECADAVGRSQKSYPDNILAVHVNCSGRVDPQFVLEAFSQGADGVIILGCHPGDCHYKEGNIHALRRFVLLKKMIRSVGLDDERLMLAWVAGGEQERFVELVSEAIKKIKVLGPIKEGKRAVK